jgi:PQQ-dependent dehydrogenase (methanol/ethanol family)
MSLGRNPMNLLILLVVTLLVSGNLPLAAQGEVKNFIPITDEVLLNPDPADWLMPSRTFDWQRFSPLDQINRDNVDQLQLAWVRGLDPGIQENIPVVYKGVMYVAAPGDVIQALDATNGDLIWEYRHALPDDLEDFMSLGEISRNLAIYDDLIFHGAADGYIVALDARTGKVRWQTQAHDYKTGSRHSSGFIVMDGKVLSGRSCATTRCFIAAHDARAGKEVWRTYTAAAPGEPGGDSWGGLPLESRIHVSPWGNPGSYDPQRQVVYWGVGVPKPYPRILRHHGDVDAVPRSSPSELYTNCTLALDVKTGKIVWYYQHLPGDDWDADHVEERILVNSVVKPDPRAVKWISSKITPGEQRDILVTLGEPGGLFALDRETGEFLWATPFPSDSPEFHIGHIDVETGQTFLNWDRVTKQVGDTVISCYKNTKSYWPMAYNPKNNSLYIPFNEECVVQTSNPDTPTGTGPRGGMPRPGSDPQAFAGLAKVNISTGEVDRFHTQPVATNGATLVTAGNLVFWGDLGRRFRAFDTDTGEMVWETILGDAIQNSTITYAVNGRQYVAVLTGWGILTGRYLSYTPEVKVPGGHNAIYVFALPESE